MKITVRTPVSQRRVVVENKDELVKKVKVAFKVDKCELFEDQRRTIPYDPNKLVDGALVYMSYEMEKPKVEKQKFECSHDENGVCPKCSTLDPLDKRRAEGKKAKYMSREGYEELLKEKNMSEEEHNYVIKKCEDHGENVGCIRCTDKKIQLMPQIYRMIDYLEFDNKEMVERMITRWSVRRRQLLGLLIGRIENYDLAYKGKKAVISGIWDICQENFPDGAVIDKIPNKFMEGSLEIVGVIYTDLHMRDGKAYGYKQTKGYSVSNSELRFLWEIERRVGRKGMVGVSVEVDGNGEVVLECRMISNQYSGLEDAGALELCTDPRVFWTSRDVSYVERNEYDKDVSVGAKLLPVEYFVVSCESGYVERPLFTNNTRIEQCTLRKLAGYFEDDYTFDKFKGFDILVSLLEFLENTPKFFSAVVRDDSNEFERLKSGPEFKKFAAELSKYTTKQWACQTCTYLNDPYITACAMCQQRK